MNQEEKINALLAGIAIGAFLGVLFTFALLSSSWESEAIEHNAAQYSPKTGEFKWIKEKRNE